MELDRYHWLGDIHEIMPEQWAGIVVTLTAVLCGGIIGFERGRAHKPAGMRTLILICLGSAVFTQASILLAGPNSDRTRIAAQIVTGIGFLGAGAIIRERGVVIGVTTGASIYSMAAVGVVVGGGYIVAGMVFTLIIYLTLTTAWYIDRWAMGPCAYKTLILSYDPAAGRTRFTIQAILDEHAHEGEAIFHEPPEGESTVEIQICETHRQHRTACLALVALPQIKSVRRG